MTACFDTFHCLLDSDSLLEFKDRFDYFGYLPEFINGKVELITTPFFQGFDILRHTSRNAVIYKQVLQGIRMMIFRNRSKSINV